MNNFRKVLFLFCLFSMTVFSQVESKKTDESFLVGLHYVNNSSNNNLLSENYNGVIGVDLKYKLVTTKIITLHPGLSFDFLTGSGSNQFGLKYNSMTILNPNIGVELDVFKSNFRPFVSLGYAFVNYSYDIKFTSIQNFDPAFAASNTMKKVKYSENNFSLQPGFRYHFKKLIYLETSYKYLPIDKNVNLHLFNIGLGLRF
jgi:opacity protein-like surface antigen